MIGPIDLILWKSILFILPNINCVALQNIFFCVQQKKEMYKSLKQVNDDTISFLGELSLLKSSFCFILTHLMLSLYKPKHKYYVS